MNMFFGILLMLLSLSTWTSWGAATPETPETSERPELIPKLLDDAFCKSFYYEIESAKKMRLLYPEPHVEKEILQTAIDILDGPWGGLFLGCTLEEKRSQFHLTATYSKGTYGGVASLKVIGRAYFNDEKELSSFTVRAMFYQDKNIGDLIYFVQSLSPILTQAGYRYYHLGIYSRVAESGRGSYAVLLDYHGRTPDESSIYVGFEGWSSPAEEVGD